MRPVRLEVQGFTSFRDRQVVDFDGLDLFTFWGPTGSGKSSLLDAITYALYGKVDRVESVGALVSQGQPRMAVLFEFEIEDARYRVGRSNPRNGSGKALLERHDGAEWRSYGEGADRIRGVNAALVELLGLDYRAFTRSVLLPQGKFAEFLVGDAGERRKILNELLGLELFTRMAKLAGETARDAKAKAGATEDLIAAEFAAVDDAALELAVHEADRAHGAVRRAEKVERELKALGKQHERVASTAEALADCAHDFDDVGRALHKQSERLGAMAREIAGARRALEAARRDRKRGDAALQEAIEGRARAEQSWGSVETLAAWRAAAGRLDDLHRRAQEERDEALRATARMNESRGAVAKAEADLATAEAAATDARHVLAEQEAILLIAQRDDLVGTLTKDLRVGDDCPVCDRPLETLKKVTPAALRTAQKTVDAARAAATKADGTAHTARTALEVARHAVKAAEEHATRSERAAARTGSEITDLRAKVDHALGPEPVDDPRGEIERRLAELNRLRAVEDKTRHDLDGLRDRLENAQRSSAALDSEIASCASTIAASPLTALLRRARKIADDIAYPDTLPDPLPQGPADLQTVAERTSGALIAAAEALTARSDAHLADQRRFVDEGAEAARAVLPEGTRLDASDMERLLGSFSAALRDLEKNALKASENVNAIRKDLEKRRGLEKDAERQRKRQAVYNALALELRGDRIVDYIQSEALCALAAAGSVRLEYLSGQRYRLAYEGDEFFVIDAWNGEERRSVRTLSGGETFLASLGLALALSDEVKTLAVTDKARIDSLFLDEGFGSLDAETLETVVGAIEQLGGDGKLVGVITHVSELAERLPVRFNVVKSPRGSTVARDL